VTESHDSHGVDGGSNPRVVVLFPGALGDLVLAMPAIAGVCARHRGAHVTLVVSGWLCALAATAGVADAIASLDAADSAGLFGGTRLPAWMRDRPILYSWIGTRDPDVAARLRALSVDANFYSVVREDGPEHAGAVYVDQAGFDPRAAEFCWPPVAVTSRVEALRAQAHRPILAVHPGAGSAAKRWALEGFQEIARRWRGAGGDVVEVAGPAESDLPPLRDAHRIADWPLVDVAALLARVEAYVGNDSGITHLAAAMGARGIAAFGPTAARRWAPRGDGITTLEATEWAASGIPLAAVTPQRVWRALIQRGCLDKVQGRT
jgi:ADP-heptose:LPS heptosyltransferase